MKIAFFGTGEFSMNILATMLEYPDFDIKLVISQPDKPVGRKKVLKKTPVRELAESKNIQVVQPERLIKNIELMDDLLGLDLDFIVVVAYGKIMPMSILNIPKYGSVNLHGSILPKYRGASPIQESIKMGDTKTGVTLMYMSKRMDEGDILRIKEVDICKTDKTEDIFKKFEQVGRELLYGGLTSIMKGELVGIAQDDSKATYCGKIDKKDGEIDFNNSAESIYNKYRAYYPWPGIYSFYKGIKIQFEECSFSNDSEGGNGKESVGSVGVLGEGKNKEIVVCCQTGLLILKQVKLAGKKSMDILSFINGNKDFLDHKF